MKIKHYKPIIYPILKWKFPIDWNVNVIAFGDTIYAKDEIPEHLVVHENTHLLRQKNSKIYGIIWWIRYIFNKKFRFIEELLAYRNQYRFIKSRLKNREEQNKYLRKFSYDLASELYGKMVDFNKAMKLIEHL